MQNYFFLLSGRTSVYGRRAAPDVQVIDLNASAPCALELGLRKTMSRGEIERARFLAALLSGDARYLGIGDSLIFKRLVVREILALHLISRS